MSFTESPPRATEARIRAAVEASSAPMQPTASRTLKTAVTVPKDGSITGVSHSSRSSGGNLPDKLLNLESVMRSNLKCMKTTEAVCLSVRRLT